MSSRPDEHVLVPGTPGESVPLVLLHGSDGSESDLLHLAHRLSPDSTRLGLRGKVQTPGGRAFFRRHPDRRVDEDDLRARMSVLREVIMLSAPDLRGALPVAVGFSNGAIMGAALLMSYPDLFSGVVLFRPLSPFAVPPAVDLGGVPVLVLDGAHDERRSAGDGARLARDLRGMHAAVTHEVLPVGHAISPQDESMARAWLRSSFP